MITYPIEICLRLIGIWPNSSYRILQRVFWTIVMGTGVTFQIWYCIFYFKTADLADLLDGLSVTLSNTVTFIKLIILWFNYRTLHNILTLVFEDWNNHALMNERKQYMKQNFHISSRISNFLVFIYSLTCIAYSATTMLIDGHENEKLSAEKKMLLKMKFPFDFTIFPLYECITIAQFVFEYSIALMASMLMALSAALVLHVGSQIDIACQELMGISHESGRSVTHILKNVTVMHQRIIHLSENIKYLFLYTSLVQFLSNVLVLCFVGFILVVSLGTKEGPIILAKCLPYYIGVNCEAFVLCYTGEYLTSKSKSISQAVYDIRWYKFDTRDSQIVLLMLMRSQRLLTLTAGKFVTLSVETFANMLKAAASYISILLTMY